MTRPSRPSRRPPEPASKTPPPPPPGLRVPTQKVRIQAPRRKTPAAIVAESLTERREALDRLEVALLDSRRRSEETLRALQAALAQAKADHDRRIQELTQLRDRLRAEIITLQEQKALVEARVNEKLEQLGHLQG